MAFKNVKIEIDSLIEDLDDSGLALDSSKNKITAEGKMKSDNGEVFLFYTETSENGKTESELSLCGRELTLKRKGGISSDFLFSEGKASASLYSVGQYAFDCEIYTRKIRTAFNEDGGEITLIYDMTLGGAKKKTKMKILVRSK